MSTLTASAFELLLAGLDAEPSAAAEKYENLRVKLLHLLQWRGCPESDADDLADKTLDRVAAKLAGGEKIENLPAFSCSVARFIWLEHSRKKKEDAIGELPEVAVDPDLSALEDPDARLQCLRDCMAETISNPADRRLIVAYYDTDSGEKNKDIRKKLAESLGITLNALKVKACRLRDRLERCINECVARVTKPGISDTNRQEVMER